MAQAVEERQLNIVVCGGARRILAGVADWNRVKGVRLLSDFQQQGAKAGLREMLIACKRLADSLFLHDDKRYAVGERPILVGPRSVKIETLLKMFMRSLDDSNARMGIVNAK